MLSNLSINQLLTVHDSPDITGMGGFLPGSRATIWRLGSINTQTLANLRPKRLVPNSEDSKHVADIHTSVLISTQSLQVAAGFGGGVLKKKHKVLLYHQRHSNSRQSLPVDNSALGWL